MTAESHSMPTSNTYCGENKEDKSTKSTLLGFSELFSIVNQLSCCQTTVAASPKAGGLNHRETQSNTVSNQNALARQLFDAMVSNRKDHAPPG
jgi:hypothetical protein